MINNTIPYHHRAEAERREADVKYCARRKVQVRRGKEHVQTGGEWWYLYCCCTCTPLYINTNVEHEDLYEDIRMHTHAHTNIRHESILAGVTIAIMVTLRRTRRPQAQPARIFIFLHLTYSSKIKISSCFVVLF